MPFTALQLYTVFKHGFERGRGYRTSHAVYGIATPSRQKN